MRGELRHAGATDVGRRRDHNEDAILDEPPLFAVADGVGGAAKGEVASSTALDVFTRAGTRVRDAGDTAATEAAMVQLVLECNAAVHEAQAGRPERAGMATTLTAAVLLGDGQVVLGHVGDSRAYAIDAGGRVRQLTDDHSLVGELVRAGQMTPEEAAEHPHRNVITRALGTEPDVQVDAAVHALRPGEWLLLCSDGLTGHVHDHELGHAVLDAASPAGAVQELVALANERGGSDNISVVLVQPLPPEGDTTSATETTSSIPAVDDGAGHTDHVGDLDIVPIELTDEHEPEHEADAFAHGASADAGEAYPSGAGHADVAHHPAWGDSAPGQVGTTQAIRAVPATPPPAGMPHDLAEPAGHPAHARAPRPRARYLKRLLFALFILVVAFVAGAVAWRQSYFLTEQKGGVVGIDQGFPVLGLHRQYQTSDVHTDDLEAADRERYVEAQTLRSREDAERLFARLPELAGRCEQQTAGGGVPADATTLRDPNC
jgi:PPM family protein phosphatase